MKLLDPKSGAARSASQIVQGLVESVLQESLEESSGVVFKVGEIGESEAYVVCLSLTFQAGFPSCGNLPRLNGRYDKYKTIAYLYVNA